MKVGDKLNCEILSLGINGEGVAKVNSFIIFVPLALMGENVKIEITSLSERFATGKILEVVDSCKDRTAPFCPYFGRCGGCQLQHLEYEKQLEFKREKVSQTLHKFFIQSINVEKCVASIPSFSYRNKIELLCSADGLGYCDNDKKIIKINNCPIFCEEIKKIIELFNSFTIDKAKILKNNKIFKSVVIRKFRKHFMFALVVNSFLELNYEKLISELNQLNIKFSLFISENSVPNSTNITHKLKLIHGDLTQNINVSGIDLKLSANSFMQINENVASKIYSEICTHISSNDIVIDAYSGAGLLSAIMAKKCRHVYAIEIVENASRDAEKLCLENNLKNVTNICADCAKQLNALMTKLNGKVSAIVLDPPRKGCDKNVINAIIGAKIPKIIYLSCNIATLSRDLSLLQEHYSIKKITPYDMFPQTSHVETLAILERK